MTGRIWLVIGSIYGFLAVVFGAFGAHALKTRLTADWLAVYRTAVEYQFYHAFALLAVGLLANTRPTTGLKVAGVSFAVGTLLFSGSLYAIALTGQRLLGVITPLGGVLFLIGWAALLLTAIRAGVSSAREL